MFQQYLIISPDFNIFPSDREDATSSKLATIVAGDLKVPVSIATPPRCRGGCYSFSWIAPLTLDLYLIMLSVK